MGSDNPTITPGDVVTLTGLARQRPARVGSQLIRHESGLRKTPTLGTYVAGAPGHYGAHAELENPVDDRLFLVGGTIARERCDDRLEIAFRW